MDSFSRIGKHIFKKQYRIAPFEKLGPLVAFLSLAEKTLIGVATSILALSTLSLLTKINDEFLVEMPAYGGTVHEGIVGTPRFVNPLLALSDADRDLSSLVYSGLMRATPEGDFVPDLAERYSISSDGLRYTFILRADARFHDGTAVTADDVEFTIEKAKDGALKSPKRPNWEGVSVEKAGPLETTFTLKQPYSPFIANATIGILPKHLWRTFESDQFPFSQYNVEPVGSGPYQIASVSRSKDGVPTSYELESFDEYALGKPYIHTFQFSFFPNEKAALAALNDGSIDSLPGISTREAVTLTDKGVALARAPLTRVFGIFFNQNQKEILSHKEIRKALGDVLDKEGIVENVLLGSGTTASSPLPPTVAEKVAQEHEETSAASTTDGVLATLKKSKWVRDSATSTLSYAPTAKSKTPLSFSLTTSNVPELVETAGIVETAWKALGADVDVKVFEPSDLNQSVIRPRKYDALLFGLVVGRDPDLYAFWHSSQRNDPGLNIAMYTNAKADKALEDMRKATSTEAASEIYKRFAKEVDMDSPAIFLYSPDFIYAAPAQVKNLTLGQITTPNDRFLSAYKWYVETDRIWGFIERLRERKSMTD